jgi:hypothetical protein
VTELDTSFGHGEIPVNKYMNRGTCFLFHVSMIGTVERTDRRNSWTLLTSHGHVLVEIARDPRARIRDLSAAAGLTERATAAIIADLEAAGYVTRTKVGRRNHYQVNLDNPFRHEAQRDLKIGPFLQFLTERPPGGGDRTDRTDRTEAA